MHNKLPKYIQLEETVFALPRELEIPDRRQRREKMQGDWLRSIPG